MRNDFGSNSLVRAISKQYPHWFQGNMQNDTQFRLEDCSFLFFFSPFHWSERVSVHNLNHSTKFFDKKIKKIKNVALEQISYYSISCFYVPN